jgi:hypothetical protein
LVASTNIGEVELLIPPQKKKITQAQGLKENLVAKKKTQPDVKKRIRKKKKKPRCSFEGCTSGSVKVGVCITHGATVNSVAPLRDVQSKSSERRTLLDAWCK